MNEFPRTLVKWARWATRARLAQEPLDSEYWVKRRQVGVGVFLGAFAGILGYLLTGIGWFWLVPPLGFAVAWRVVHGRWPLSY